MPRAKDTKVWNEDLVTALRSREERCRQQFSQRQYVWRDGAAAIAAIRKDIYQYKNGRIVNLPRTLTKSVEEECRAIIEGNRPILAEGYLPTTVDEKKLTRCMPTPKVVNPCHDDPYLKRIKMRGGAYAILMAFHHSESKTMTQKQICTAAQNFCDEEMEANFYSGRSYGAWSSKKTLVKHGLVKESRTTQMGRHGIVCSGVFEYMLTENGEQFVEALLVKFPQASNRLNKPSTGIGNPLSTTSSIRSEHPVKKELIKQDNVMSECERFHGEGIKAAQNAESKQLKPKNKIVVEDWLYLSDSEHSDQEEALFDTLMRHKQQRKRQPARFPSASVPDVIDLIDSGDDESLSGCGTFHEPGKNKTNTCDGRILLRSCENIPRVNRPVPMKKKAINSSSKLVIVIDNRERNRNATPRQMRIELSRHLSQASGSLRQVWPGFLPIGEVEEEQLNYGDFAFVLQPEICGTNRRLPITIERKRVSDLVQRSSLAHHWQQLHRMRDCCEHAILLIEGNTRKTSNFVSHENIESDESWNPDHHTIDDEHAFYRFLGRAILSSPVLKFLQTPHEQASYRSIGATGLVASLLSWKKDAPKQVPSTKMNLNELYNKLKSRGIPWQISRRISEELGSIEQLDNIYERCEASSRASVLVPTINESCSSMIETENSRSIIEYGTVGGWSSAIHSAWYSRLNDPSKALTLYEENKYFANDRAQLLMALHRGKTPDRAVQESNITDAKNLDDGSYSQRKVRIECSSKFSTVFPTDIATNTFYETISTDENPLGLILPSVVMQTNNGSFESRKLVACIIEGLDLFQRIKDGVEDQLTDDFYDVSKAVAQRISSECSSFLMCPRTDRRVLLIRGLGAAMGAAAKQSMYRAEYRVLVDLVIAELMLRYNIVVIQAPRLVGDLEMVLREFAMACFYYQLTTRKLR